MVGSYIDWRNDLTAHVACLLIEYPDVWPECLENNVEEGGHISMTDVMMEP